MSELLLFVVPLAWVLCTLGWGSWLQSQYERKRLKPHLAVSFFSVGTVVIYLCLALFGEAVVMIERYFGLTHSGDYAIGAGLLLLPAVLIVVALNIAAWFAYLRRFK